MNLDTADAAELTELLQFITGWLASDPDRLAASLLGGLAHERPISAGGMRGGRGRPQGRLRVLLSQPTALNDQCILAAEFALDDDAW
jgi:hypothetical protein